jgi:hypothetical protein
MVPVLGVVVLLTRTAFANNVEVFKDGASAGSRTTITDALKDLVPDPLDGDYELIIGSGKKRRRAFLRRHVDQRSRYQP